MAASKMTQGAIPPDKKLTQGAWQEVETEEEEPTGGTLLLHPGMEGGINERMSGGING